MREQKGKRRKKGKEKEKGRKRVRGRKGQNMGKKLQKIKSIRRDHREKRELMIKERKN